MDKLSNELVTHIFELLDSPGSFSRTCKNFHQLSKDPWIVASYLSKKHGKRFAFYEAIKLGRACTSQVIDNLITQGAVLSKLLSLIVYERYTKPSEPSLFCIEKFPTHFSTPTSISVSTFATICLLTEKLYGPEVFSSPSGLAEWYLCLQTLLSIHCIAIDVDSAAIAYLGDLNFMDGITHAFELKERNEQYFVLIKKQIEEFKLGPYFADSLMEAETSLLVILEPRLLPIFEATGWRFNETNNDTLMRNLIIRGLPINSDAHMEHVVGGMLTVSLRYQVIATEIEKMINLAPPNMFYVSATLAGEIRASVSGSSNGMKRLKDAKLILAYLEAANKLDFTIAEIEADNLKLAHNTIRSASFGTKLLSFDPSPTSPVSPQLSALHYFSHTTFNQSILRPLGAIPAGFGSQTSRTTGIEVPATVNRNTRKDPPTFTARWSTDQKIEFYVSVLCNVFLVSPDVVLYDAATSSELDLSEIVLRSAIKMIRIPSKGATLLSLVTKYPFIKPHIKSEILKHKISLDLLKPLNDDYLDPSRPLYTYRPSFMSPIAFHYEEAGARYPLGLDPHPWVELCYSNGLVPAPPEDPFISTSIFPAKQKEYTKLINEKLVSRGRVTGNAVDVEDKDKKDDLNNLWIEDRVPAGSLPIAIALLDIFDSKDEVLSIVLSHAFLNINPAIIHFYLTKGVPYPSPEFIEVAKKITEICIEQGMVWVEEVLQEPAKKLKDNKLKVVEIEKKKQIWRRRGNKVKKVKNV